MPIINCTEFERALEESATQRVPADSTVLRDHADRCPHCRIQWERYAVLERVIPLWKSRRPEADLSDVVLARFRAESSPEAGSFVHGISESVVPRRRPADGDFPTERDGRLESAIGVSVRPDRSSRRARSVVLAVAALVLFLAIRPLFLPMQTPAPRSQRIAAMPLPPPTGVAPRVPAAAGLTELFRDAGSAYSDLARSAADAVGDAAAFVPSAVAVRSENDSASAGSQAKTNWTKKWQRPFEPIGHDVSHAVDFLFDKMKTL